MQESNPYAPPSAHFVPPQMVSLYRRDGEYLVVRDFAVLPERCVLTNEDIGPRGWSKKKLLTWTPAWIWLFLVLGALPAILLASITQKRVNLTFSLSRPQRNRQLKRSALALLAMLLGIGCIFASAANDKWMAACLIAGFVLLLGGLIAAVVLSSAIRVKRFKDGEFWIKGCSPLFLASLD